MLGSMFKQEGWYDYIPIFVVMHVTLNRHSLEKNSDATIQLR